MKNISGTIVISVSIIITALILSGAWVKSHKKLDNTIYVTGLAAKDFTSDLIVWNCSFSRKSMSIKDAYKSLKKDADNIKSYLIKKGVNEKEIVFTSVSIEREFRTEIINNIKNQIFDGFRLTQRVKIESREVEKIENVSREVTELIDLDIEMNSMEPIYLYTKLAELKIEMIAKATTDARTRAEQIAKSSGSGLGGLKSANMGVFQITGQNSAEEFSYGGTFNTSSKNKTASITVRLEFGID
jgi:uncharacterized protein